MKRLNLILSFVLALQIVFAVSLYFDQSNTLDSNREMALTRMVADDIQQLSIRDDQDQQVNLSRSDGNWTLPDYFQLPAANGKPESLLARIQEAKSGWPVTTTTASHARFKVAEKDFNKEVSLTSADGSSETFFLGTSPGFRQVHFRRAGENEVYAVKLNHFDFPSDNTDWFDRTVLQLKDDITRLSTGDITLHKHGETWTASDGSDNVDIDTTQAQALIDALKSLNIQHADDSGPAEFEQKMTVHTADTTYRYQWYQRDNAYYVKRDDWQPAFRVSTVDYEQFSRKQITSLAKAATPGPQPEVSDNQQDDGADKNTESNS